MIKFHDYETNLMAYSTKFSSSQTSKRSFRNPFDKLDKEPVPSIIVEPLPSILVSQNISKQDMLAPPTMDKTIDARDRTNLDKTVMERSVDRYDNY